MFNNQWIATSRLWLVTDRRASHPRQIPEMLREVLPLGIDVVVFRLNDADDSEFAELAGTSMAVCSEYGIPLVVSHRISIALSIGAAGVHLGVGDPPFDNVQSLIPAEMSLGYSTHSLDEATSCINAGCDYVFLGPVFETPEKLKYGRPIGCEVIPQAAEYKDRIVYIGGMDPESTARAVEWGAEKVAAIRAVQSPDSFKTSIPQMREALTRANS